MAARTTTKKALARKAVRKSASRKPGLRPGEGLRRLERELPQSLREALGRLQAGLDRLEGEVARARALYRRRASRLLREASRRLARLEALGEGSWRELNTGARRELAALLRRLERAVDPAPARRRKA